MHRCHHEGGNPSLSGGTACNCPKCSHHNVSDLIQTVTHWHTQEDALFERLIARILRHLGK